MAYVGMMAGDLGRARWKGQRPREAMLRRALRIRPTMFVPRQGDAHTDGRAAWLGADATPPAHAARRYLSIEHATVDDKGSDRGGNDDPLSRPAEPDRG
jgi:hypothetical protein